MKVMSDSDEKTFRDSTEAVNSLSSESTIMAEVVEDVSSVEEQSNWGVLRDLLTHAMLEVYLM